MTLRQLLTLPIFMQRENQQVAIGVDLYQRACASGADTHAVWYCSSSWPVQSGCSHPGCTMADSPMPSSRLLLPYEETVRGRSRARTSLSGIPSAN